MRIPRVGYFGVGKIGRDQVADLQNDPEEIPRLLPMLDEQKVDMITGWRKDRQDTAFRKWQSRQANRIRNWISKETVNDSASAA